MPYYEDEDPTMATELTKKVQAITYLLPAADPVKDSQNFLNYIITKDQVLFNGRYSTIYACFNPQEATNLTLMCRVFQPSSKIDPQNDLYLKILKTLDRKNPNIITTLDVFSDEQNYIYLFQELANRGNCLEYLRAGNYVDLKQMCRWAVQIWSALDFLGENAIAHRSIRPKHILVQASPNGQLDAKLSGFRDAILYWDPETKSVIRLPKKSWDMIRYANFQAPDTCSRNSGESFNPIEADIWSYGATFFYMIARLYPFDLINLERLESIENDINHRIESSLTLTDGAKKWLRKMLTVDARQRTKFSGILDDSWIKSELST